jgi:hypothetical protein
MFVLLNSCGNIDFGQNPYESLSGVPSEWKYVCSLEEASIACRKYIEQYDLGGGNWYGGYIFESLDFANSKQLAYISYNGRIWTEGEYMLKYKAL